jgi:hypothetical protein
LRTWILAALIAFGVGVGARDLARSDFIPLQRQMLDFRVAYCAGVAVDTRADPYRIEPARTCQHRYPAGPLVRSPNLVMPFVSPGYVAATMGAFAALPFPLAAVLFETLTLVAIALSIALLARTLRVPLLTAAAAILLSQFPTLTLGQFTGFELLALMATAAALAAGRDVLAGVLAAGTLIEPHVGIFVVLALGAWVPRARVALVLSALASLAIAIAATSWSEQLTNLRLNLPAQAVASLHSQDQYGFSYLLALAGLPDRAALGLGTASTVVLFVLAIACARATERAGQRAGIALVPAALSVTGGAYIHLTQIALAVPAALLLVKLAPTRLGRMLAGSALVLLAIPWFYPAMVKGLLAFALVTCAILIWYLTKGSIRATACAVVACGLTLWFAENHLPPAEPVPIVRAWPADALVEDEWREFIDGSSGRSAFYIAAKLPTWIGLLALAGSGVILVRRSPHNEGAPLSP